MPTVVDSDDDPLLSGVHATSHTRATQWENETTPGETGPDAFPIAGSNGLDPTFLNSFERDLGCPMIDMTVHGDSPRSGEGVPEPLCAVVPSRGRVHWDVRSSGRRGEG